MREIRGPEKISCETILKENIGSEISRLREGDIEQPRIDGRTSIFNESPLSGKKTNIEDLSVRVYRGVSGGLDRGSMVEQPKINRKTDISDVPKVTGGDDKKADLPEQSESQVKRSSEVVETEKIPCRNEDLAGKEHPTTGVRFERRTEIVNGKKKEVVSPVFESKFDAKLPKDKLEATDRDQFEECNAQLKDAVENDPELRGKFSEEELEQIENGDTPDGYTWHHDSKPGKMQLVDTEIHAKTGHTGGRVIWGGGNENRGG